MDIVFELVCIKSPGKQGSGPVWHTLMDTNARARAYAGRQATRSQFAHLRLRSAASSPAAEPYKLVLAFSKWARHSVTYSQQKWKTHVYLRY